MEKKLKYGIVAIVSLLVIFTFLRFSGEEFSRFKKTTCITIEGEGDKEFCGSSVEQILLEYSGGTRDPGCGMCTSNIACQGSNGGNCDCPAKSSNHAERCSTKKNPQDSPN